MNKLRVLHLEDSQDDSALVLRELRKHGIGDAYLRVDTRDAFLDALRSGEWDVILSDYAIPAYNGLAALGDLRALGKDVPFILVSGTIGESFAVDAMRAGARDYVLKDQLARLGVAVEREVREARGRAERDRMREQLVISERMASAGTLAAGIAHEINNPLAVVMANLELISGVLAKMAPETTTPIDGPIRDMHEALERIRDIVRDVKIFSRPHDDQRASVDLRRVVESSVRMAWNETRHRAQLVRSFGETPPVRANGARLGQVLVNLLVNAAQAIPDGRASDNTITISTSTEGSRVVVEIRDTGVGISKENLERIYDPFFTTKPIGVGTGLGLAICFRIVKDFGGEISVESEIGKGTAFRLELLVADEPATTTPQAIAPQRVSTRRAKLLVVDDEVLISRVLVRTLAPYHDAVGITEGADAIARVAAGERYDAILSDLMMPEVTGMEVHAEIARIAPEQAERMIFLTGGAFTPKAREFLASVPNPRIEKPFELTNLLAMIASMMR